MGSDDILPPQAPKVDKEKPKKSGFFSFFKKEEKDELAQLRQDLGLHKKPSIQEAFENSQEKSLESHLEDQAPLPPEEVAEAIPAPQETKEQDEPSDDQVTKEEISELEEKFEPLSIFKLQGTPVATLDQLREYIDQKNPSVDKVVDWINQRSFREGLAEEIAETTSKKELVELLDIETGRIPQPKKRPEHVHHTDTDLHFEQLSDKHHKAIEELQGLVEGTSDEKPDLKKTFKLKHNKLVESLLDLSSAVTLTKESTYTEALNKNKKEFEEWLKELVHKASHVNALQPQKLREEFTSLLKKHQQEIDLLIETRRNELIKQANTLIQDEDAFLKKKQELDEREEEIAHIEKEIKEQRHLSDKELTKIEKKLETVNTKSKNFSKDYKKRIQELKTQTDSLDKKLKEKDKKLKQRWDKKFKELAAREKNIIKQEAYAKKRTELLDKREEDFDKQAKTFDDHLREREELVQTSVNKILAIDKDIKEQREEIEHMKEEVEHAGFKNYLKAELEHKDVFTPHPNEDPLRRNHPELFNLIDECNSAIEAKSFEQANSSYKELQRIYKEEKLTRDEKDLLYDAIREIYTNLHLAMLES